MIISDRASVRLNSICVTWSLRSAQGGELFECIKDMNKFSEPQARHVFRQLLEGVKYLHDHGIVHRDLKLENILVMDVKTLSIKISDFGLANVIDEFCFLNTVCGTPSYGKSRNDKFSCTPYCSCHKKEAH